MQAAAGQVGGRAISHAGCCRAGGWQPGRAISHACSCRGSLARPLVMQAAAGRVGSTKALMAGSEAGRQGAWSEG